MWGYKNYLQKMEINEPMNKFLQDRNYNFKRMDDMIFLEQLYDKMQGNILGHDHFFKFPENKDFPNF